MNKIIVVGLLSLVLCAYPSMAKTSVDIGTAGIGARPLGLGKAYVGIADDTNTLFLNPAGLANQKKWSLTSMSTKLLGRADYKLFGSIFPTALGNIGIGFITVSTPAGYKTTTDEASLNGATGISYQSSKAILSYGRETPITNLSFGADVDLFSQGFSGDDAAALGYGLNLSLLYQTNEEIKLGLNFNPASNLKLGSSFITMDNKLLLAVDADFTPQEPICLHTGAEFKPQEFLSLRLGIDQDPLSATQVVTSFCGGIGLSISGVDFDYAYRQDSGLADNAAHYFSITLCEPETRPIRTSTIEKEEKDSPTILSRGKILLSADMLL